MVVGDWSGTAELFLPEQGWREKAWFPIAGMIGTVCLKFSSRELRGWIAYHPLRLRRWTHAPIK